MANLEQAKKILCRLETAGHSAYFVGGCVRDRLLGRPVHDWDIATAAMPQQIMELFSNCVPTGLQHGTVTVCEAGENYEVTTFRTDGGYRDGRHPSSVQFVPELEKDLCRRDFTINAMAMDAGGTVIDLYGGQADLAARKIRCVGNAAKRFREDALRMLRAVRFSAQLGFSITPETAAAMEICAPLCQKLSAERVRDEVERTLLSPNPRAVEEMLRLGMLEPFVHCEAYDLTALGTAPCVRTARWTALKLGIPELDLARFRLDRKTTALCTLAAVAWKPQFTPLEMKRLVAGYGWEVAACVCGLNGQQSELEALRVSNQCVTLSQLAVTGCDLDWLTGPAVGQMLKKLLSYVLEHPAENIRPRLLALAKQWEK